MAALAFWYFAPEGRKGCYIGLLRVYDGWSLAIAL